MRIAVLSDTHDRYPPFLPKLVKDADEIWHLGDVCDPATLADFEELGKPLNVVGGNCDEPGAWPERLCLERGGVSCLLVHIPPEKTPSEIDVVLHGHTHVPRDETIAGVRWLNPGCVTRPRGAGASFAWLTIAAGRIASWERVRL